MGSFCVRRIGSSPEGDGSGGEQCTSCSRPQTRDSAHNPGISQLVVEPQQVVPSQAETADGWVGFKTSVRPVPMGAVEPGCEALGALRGGVVGEGVGPLALGGLDEAFGFAVGRWGERPGVAMAQAALGTAGIEGPGTVTPAVVSEHVRPVPMGAVEPGCRLALGGGEAFGFAVGRWGERPGVAIRPRWAQQALKVRER